MGTTRAAGIRAVVIGTIIVVLVSMVTVGEVAADQSRRARPPKVEIQQDGPMLETTWHRMERAGAVKLGWRLRGVDRDFQLKGETESPQVKLVLRQGETYRFSVRAFYPDRGWSDWTKPRRFTGGETKAHPWTVQVEAGDQELRVSWADTTADSYRYRVWSDYQLVRSGSTEDTEVVIDGLHNGSTYYVTVRGRHGRSFTRRTPALAATPNGGDAVGIGLRNYVVEPLTGPERQPIPTPVIGARERITSMTVTLAPTNRSRQSLSARFDENAVGNDTIPGAYATEPAPIEPLDYEVIAEARGHDGVLASSLQTWLIGSVDAFAPDTDPFTRVGTYR